MSSFVQAQYPLVFLSSIHKRRYRQPNNLQTFIVPGDMILVITAGNGIIRIGKEVFTLQLNHSFYLRESSEIEVILESSYVDYYIMVLNRVTAAKRNGKWAYSVTHSDKSELLPPGKLPLTNIKQAVERVKQLYVDSRNHAKHAAGLQLQFQSLLQFILQDIPEQGIVETASKGIDQSIGYMYKHYHEKIKLDVLADIAGLTETSYSRSFKKAKGVSPVEYLNQIRIDSSKQLLQQQDCSVKEVADSVGFGNEFYFSKMFKRSIGMSPSFYMRRQQLKIGAASCFHYHNNLRSLGVKEYAAINCHRNLPYYTDEYNRMLSNQLNELRNARPDIILADYRHTLLYEQLKQIAPTILLDYTMDWRKNHMRIAELVGREKEAQQHFSQLEQKVNYARKMLALKLGDETLSVIRLYDHQLRVQGLTDHPLNDLLFSELGLKPSSIVPLHERLKDFAIDKMPPFETDHIFLHKHLQLAGPEESFSRLQQSQSWQGMKAIRNNRFYLISNWIGLSWSPEGQNQIIDELLERTKSL
ncbi:MAG: transcriptional regulator [Paenibacillus sp.]|nr:transcriptional regulator [Paenibacillus sp.]